MFKFFYDRQYAVPLILVSCALPILAVLFVTVPKVATVLLVLTVVLWVRHHRKAVRQRRDELNYRRQTYGF